MSKTRARAGSIAEESEDAPSTPVRTARDAADAMYRAACECCHQHDRVARILTKSTNDDEVRAAQRLCGECTKSLSQFAKSYEDTAAAIRPDGADEEWWHRANALWLASREYLRRNRCCDASTREMKHHDRERFGALQTDYELEASSLLALRTAADTYRLSRPDAL
jgi:hypothetical protein